MKSKITILLVLICMSCSFHLLTSESAQANQVNLELVIPDGTDESESIHEIDKEVSKTNGNTSSDGSSNKNTFSVLPETGESLMRFTLIGGVCIILSLVVFNKKKLVSLVRGA